MCEIKAESLLMTKKCNGCGERFPKTSKESKCDMCLSLEPPTKAPADPTEESKMEALPAVMGEEYKRNGDLGIPDSGLKRCGQCKQNRVPAAAAEKHSLCEDCRGSKGSNSKNEVNGLKACENCKLLRLPKTSEKKLCDPCQKKKTAELKRDFKKCRICKSLVVTKYSKNSMCNPCIRKQCHVCFEVAEDQNEIFFNFICGCKYCIACLRKSKNSRTNFYPVQCLVKDCHKQLH